MKADRSTIAGLPAGLDDEPIGNWLVDDLDRLRGWLRDLRSRLEGFRSEPQGHRSEPRGLRGRLRILRRWSRAGAAGQAEPAEQTEPAERAETALGSAAAPGPFAFPIFLEVRGRTVFVAGGGRVAASKADALARLGAIVRIWAPEHRSTRRLEGAAGVSLEAGAFSGDLLEGALLALVATGDRDLDHMIAAEARARRVLVNTIDDIPFCDWSAPSILRRGDLTIAVGTGGVAPALAVRIRDRLGAELGPEYGELVGLFGLVRPAITASDRPFADRRALWYALVDGPAIDHLRHGRRPEARRSIDAAIAAWETAPTTREATG